MKKKFLTLFTILTVAALAIGCGDKATTTESTNEAATETVQETEQETAEETISEETEESTAKLDIEDGVYEVDFTTDSSMFHINETLNDKAVLTVENGVGTVHITLTSKNIVNLYSGFAADAEADEENWLQPTLDEVTYDDGMTEEVNGFDVPVPVIGEEFDLALLGTKGTWYDHKVVVANPVAIEE